MKFDAILIKLNWLRLRLSNANHHQYINPSVAMRLNGKISNNFHPLRTIAIVLKRFDAIRCYAWDSWTVRKNIIPLEEIVTKATIISISTAYRTIKWNAFVDRFRLKIDSWHFEHWRWLRCRCWWFQQSDRWWRYWCWRFTLSIGLAKTMQIKSNDNNRLESIDEWNSIKVRSN